MLRGQGAKDNESATMELMDGVVEKTHFERC